MYPGVHAQERPDRIAYVMKVAIRAAAPCPVPVKEQMIEWWGPVLHEYYAGTEGNGFTAIDSHAWLAHKGSVGRPLTGSVHIVDDDGQELPPGLYLTDRKAHMIISGGVNIYPQETENVLVTHPKVADAAVIGVPDEDFGEAVKAVVQPLDMADVGPELAQELIDFCRERLSRVKCPRSVDFEAELPRHPTGKLYKRLLKDRYWTGHQTRIV